MTSTCHCLSQLLAKLKPVHGGDLPEDPFAFSAVSDDPDLPVRVHRGWLGIESA